MADLFQVNIRPHLISFLFQELEGETQANYEGKQVKLAKISRASLLGSLISVCKNQAKTIKKGRPGSYSVFLTITDNTVVSGIFHEKKADIHSVLELLPEHVILVNDFLENVFRLSLVQFIKGYAINSTRSDFVNRAIEQFMINHNLYDTNVDPETLRRHYYNSLKKKHTLTRIQNQISNKSYNYHAV